jgi:hypothetical protein
MTVAHGRGCLSAASELRLATSAQAPPRTEEVRDGCYALVSHGPTTTRFWPEWRSTPGCGADSTDATGMKP